MILSLLLRRAVFFIAFVLVFALVAAAVAHSATGARSIVAFSGFAPGTVVVKTSERSLYFVLDEQRALRFPVGVGKAGMTWTGTARVEGKYVKPAWQAPDEIRHDHPNLPDVIPGGAANNPMGAAALTLRGGEYAIHGTNQPGSIGHFVSYGCIRMHNRDIVELYRLVPVGAPVIVEQ
jgi:lipoprotein-anchoring transpeptidase ErfK/SrfK